MKTLNTQAFEEIRRWIFRNARPLDLALWQYHFETGSREAILAILSHYQNRDGGFGYAIEPDNWNPASTPYNAHFVVRILRMIDFLDTTHPIYQGIFRHLEHTGDQADYGWFFIIPSNNHYPHAIWWDYNPEKNVFQSTGITAILSGFILRHGDQQSNLYKIATEYAKTLIEKLPTTTNFGDMGLKGYSELLDDIEAAGLGEDFNCQYLREKLQDLVWSKIHDEKDNFMANPLEFIFSPNSRFYEKNQLEVEAVLDQLIDQRPASGVWDIPWEWYKGNQYAKAFAISENWWKSFQAIEKLLQLKRFGRLSL